MSGAGAHVEGRSRRSARNDIGGSVVHLNLFYQFSCREVTCYKLEVEMLTVILSGTD